MIFLLKGSKTNLCVGWLNLFFHLGNQPGNVEMDISVPKSASGLSPTGTGSHDNFFGQTPGLLAQQWNTINKF